jgi:hypothetical protein
MPTWSRWASRHRSAEDFLVSWNETLFSRYSRVVVAARPAPAGAAGRAVSCCEVISVSFRLRWTPQQWMP